LIANINIMWNRLFDKLPQCETLFQKGHDWY